MATLLSLKRRINAAKNVSKTTKAMQMIAASKLKRAQDAALNARPYVEKLTVLAQDASAKTTAVTKHPYMESPADNHKTLLIAISPDKGLCGGLITNLTKEFLSFIDTEKDVPCIIVGKKIEQQVVKLPNEVLATFNFGNTLPTFDMVFPLKKLIDDYYLTGKVARVMVLTTDFANFFSQTPRISQLLPLTLPEQEVKADTYQIVEPSIDALVPTLLEHYVEMTLFQTLLESYLSEQASRMITMQNATNNAKDIIESLQLEYNKTRQANITSELLDLMGGRAIHG